jgi:hypothetical protein
MVIEQAIEIPPNHRLYVDVPPEVPTGKVILTFTPVSAAKKTPKPGCMKGKIWMADDFDAPLDDFKEYME